MKGLSVRAAVLLSAAIICHPGTADAQTVHRVVLDGFAGPGGTAFRDQMVAALVEMGHQVIPAGKVESAAAELNVSATSDNLTAIAKEVKATLVVQGVIATEKRKTTARLTAKKPDGAQLGTTSWTGTGVGDVLMKIRPSLVERLTSVLSGKPEAEAQAKAPAPPRRVQNPGTGTVVELMDEAAQQSSEASEEGGVPRPRRTLSNSIDLSAGAHLYSRTFVYNDSRVGQQQGYQATVVPAPALAVDYFVLPWLGVSLSGEYSIFVSEQDPAGNVVETSSLGYSVGAKLRFDVLGSDVSITGGFGENAFSVDEQNASAPGLEIADVAYRQVKGGASLRVPLGRLITLIGGGSYLHLLAAGEIASDRYFPNIRGYGGEGYAGLGFKVAPQLELRVAGTIRRHAFTMNSLPTDIRQAGGATDQYLGVNMSIAYRD
jgi:hypothetical protein